MGIPSRSGKAELSNLYKASLGKHSLAYAQYGVNGQEASQELYLQGPKGRYKRRFHLGLCSDFYLIQLGPKAPVLILAHDSACGSGFTDYIHGIGRNGKLDLILRLQCRKTGWKAVDINRDGRKEIIHSDGIEGFPPDLKSKLDKLKIHKSPKGPVLQRVEILKWSGDRFVKAGEYYEHGEAW